MGRTADHGTNTIVTAQKRIEADDHERTRMSAAHRRVGPHEIGNDRRGTSRENVRVTATRIGIARTLPIGIMRVTEIGGTRRVRAERLGGTPSWVFRRRTKRGRDRGRMGGVAVTGEGECASAVGQRNASNGRFAVAVANEVLLLQTTMTCRDRKSRGRGDDGMYMSCWMYRCIGRCP